MKPSKTPPTNIKIAPGKEFPKPKKEFQKPGKDIQKPGKDIPLLDIKKESLKDGDTHFEKRPEKTKNRDLLPALPTPKSKKDTPSWLNNKATTPDNTPPPPSIDTIPKPPAPELNKKPLIKETTEEKN